VGRNGAGKSTLLKILSGITEPTEGRAEIRGRVASLLEVGTGFHAELTGRENVFLNGAILGMSRGEIKAKFDEIVAFAGVEQFVDTPVKHYSSGMYMRLGFSVAAHLEPDILIVDEVLAVGDVQFQKKCLGKLESVARSGRTVLFVSHNLSAVSTLCSSAIWLHHGRAMAQGRVADILQQYRQNLSGEAGTHGTPHPELRFLTVRFDSAERRHDGSLGPFSPCRIEAVFETRRTLDPAEVNLHVQDAQGRHCIHLRTDFDGLAPRFEPGRHRIVVEIESLNLESQIYFFWLRLVGRRPQIHVDSESLPLEIRAEWDRHEASQPVVAVRRRWAFGPAD
jgi:lipopolysaccharide transport system ATP-binding protein